MKYVLNTEVSVILKKNLFENLRKPQISLSQVKAIYLACIFHAVKTNME